MIFDFGFSIFDCQGVANIALPGRVLAEWPTFTFAPALPACVLAPGIIVALVLGAWLYREQRRMAPLGTVLVLTVLRGLLIVLLAVLFLQPALQWKSTKTSSGTLWIVVDQSPSMQTQDPQASEAERLQWAEGAGLIKRPQRPDELLTRISVLADELDALTPDSSAGLGGGEKQVVRAFADRVEAWTDDLRKLIAQAEAMRGALDGYKASAGTEGVTNLQGALTLAKKRLSDMRSMSTLREAYGALDAYGIGLQLKRAATAFSPAIAEADAAYVRQNASHADWIAAADRIGRMKREELTQAFLAANDAPGAKPLEELAKKYHLRIAGFSDKAVASGSIDGTALAETLKTAMATSGQATNVASALQFAAEQIAADEAASVILVTDGRNNTGPDPTGSARNLASRGVRVYGLLIGSHELSPDAAVEPVDFPDWIYAGDSLKARAAIRLDGLIGKTASVELRRGGTGPGAGQILQRQTITASKSHEMVPFEFTETPPASDKVLEYEIRVSQMPGEVNTQNNVATFRVAVKKDKLYALVIEDRPRWEFRYLAAYLSRRPGMKTQTVLLQPALITGVLGPAAVMASPENPRTEAQLLPETLEQWEKFDLIVLGDVGPETLTAEMQQYIATTVRDKGATLITIAGQRSMPERFAQTALADLLPVTINDPGSAVWTAEQLSSHTRAGFRPTEAPAAGMSVLAQLASDSSGNSRAWTNMPPWYWHSTFTQVKPAAVAVWSIGEIGGRGMAGGGGGGGGDPLGTIAEANKHALLATMTVGLGRSLYLASDQTWRMRQVGGANLHERFWGQVFNWAVGSDLPAGGKYVRFGANQATYEQTQPVVITARVLKDDLTPYRGLAFTAVARAVRPMGAGGAAGGGSGNTVEARFEPMESPGYYQATLTGLPIGDVEISLRGTEVERLLDSDPSVTLRSLLIKVYPTLNAERQNMNSDPALLETITRAGGGFSVDGPYADVLLSRMPKIEHVETSVYQLGFFTDPAAAGTKWAHWGFLGLFAVVITLEWGLRKRAGLV